MTLIRSLFNENGVVQVCAPTGTAAFNAGGETLHHFLKNKAGMKKYDAFSMSEKKKKDLSVKLKNLLCVGRNAYGAYVSPMDKKVHI